MIITVQNEYRVEVELTKHELTQYGITYEELDYADIETRRVLWCLFDDIKRKSGISMSLSGKLLIEVMKENPDKYKICFTSINHNSDLKSFKQLVKNENSPVSADFCEFEHLLCVLQGGLKDCYESSLYEKNGKYRLIFFVPKEEKPKIFRLLNEFGGCKDGAFVEKAQCEEHWHCLIKNCAVKTLSEVFSVRTQPLPCHP